MEVTTAQVDAAEKPKRAWQPTKARIASLPDDIRGKVSATLKRIESKNGKLSISPRGNGLQVRAHNGGQKMSYIGMLRLDTCKFKTRSKITTQQRLEMLPEAVRIKFKELQRKHNNDLVICVRSDGDLQIKTREKKQRHVCILDAQDGTIHKQIGVESAQIIERLPPEAMETLKQLNTVFERITLSNSRNGKFAVHAVQKGDKDQDYVGRLTMDGTFEPANSNDPAQHDKIQRLIGQIVQKRAT